MYSSSVIYNIISQSEARRRRKVNPFPLPRRTIKTKLFGGAREDIRMGRVVGKYLVHSVWCGWLWLHQKEKEAKSQTDCSIFHTYGRWWLGLGLGLELWVGRGQRMMCPLLSSHICGWWRWCFVYIPSGSEDNVYIVRKKIFAADLKYQPTAFVISFLHSTLVFTYSQSLKTRLIFLVLLPSLIRPV